MLSIEDLGSCVLDNLEESPLLVIQNSRLLIHRCLSFFQQKDWRPHGQMLMIHCRKLTLHEMEMHHLHASAVGIQKVKLFVYADWKAGLVWGIEEIFVFGLTLQTEKCRSGVPVNFLDMRFVPGLCNQWVFNGVTKSTKKERTMHYFLFSFIKCNTVDKLFHRSMIHVWPFWTKKLHAIL